MSKDQKYYIKYLTDSSCPKNLYWFKGDGEWVSDPNRATLFNNPEGITEVGRLLVEHEWITKLVPEVELSKVKTISPPKTGFIVIVDCEGNPVNAFSREIANNDWLFAEITKLDKDIPNYAPHSIWQSCVGGFTRIFHK